MTGAQIVEALILIVAAIAIGCLVQCHEEHRETVRDLTRTRVDLEAMRTRAVAAEVLINGVARPPRHVAVPPTRIGARPRSQFERDTDPAIEIGNAG